MRLPNRSPRPSTFIAAITIASAFASPSPVAAQHRDRIAVAMEAQSQSQHSLVISPLQQTPEASTGKLVFGGIALGLAGLVGGAYIAAGLASQGCNQGEEYCGLGGAIVGAIVGESVMLPLGVHLANSMQGSYPLAAVVSTAVGVAGLTMAATSDGPGIVFAIPIIQMISSIAIERRGD